MANSNPLASLVEGNPSREQSLALGAVAGIVVGVLAALSYNRAAEENARAGNGGRRVQTGELVSIGLALLALLRQVAELGRVPAKKR